MARGACEKCRVSGPKGFLAIHHIDGRSNNDAIENLILLCPNCHRLADLAIWSGKSVANH
jgi:predicted HNH restriction endonuclease